MTDEEHKKLLEPFKEIEWRVDRGYSSDDGNFVFVLAYADAREYRRRLDEVLGPDNWKVEIREVKNGYICRLSFWSEAKREWLCREDGSDENRVAVKGGISTAFKRACTMLGLGAYLYDIPQQRCRLMDKGENYAKLKVRGSGGQETWIKGYWTTPKINGNPGDQNQQPKKEPPKRTGPTGDEGRESINMLNTINGHVKSQEQRDAFNNLLDLYGKGFEFLDLPLAVQREIYDNILKVK